MRQGSRDAAKGRSLEGANGRTGGRQEGRRKEGAVKGSSNPRRAPPNVATSRLGADMPICPLTPIDIAHATLPYLSGTDIHVDNASMPWMSSTLARGSAVSTCSTSYITFQPCTHGCCHPATFTHNPHVQGTAAQPRLYEMAARAEPFATKSPRLCWLDDAIVRHAASQSPVSQSHSKEKSLPSTSPCSHAVSACKPMGKGGRARTV